jgi:hypothetical protein
MRPHWGWENRSHRSPQLKTT